MRTDFDWIQRQSKYFGQVYEPYANVEILHNSKKRWQGFVFKIDSGAIVSLMNLEDCTLLGYDFEDGQKVLLDAVQGSPVIARVHSLNIRLKGTNIIKTIRIAFSEKPIQPLLLGVLEVFDFFDIEFRGRIGKTFFYK